MAIRTTIYLDQALLERSRKFVPPRGLSQLINDLLAERIAELERQALIAEVREGYIVTRAERQEVAEEWQALDREGWPV
ncbi:MAG: hypothetical protein Fur005_13830 [Roseiflexaceae bacterium]